MLRGHMAQLLSSYLVVWWRATVKSPGAFLPPEWRGHRCPQTGPLPSLEQNMANRDVSKTNGYDDDDESDGDDNFGRLLQGWVAPGKNS